MPRRNCAVFSRPPAPPPSSSPSRPRISSAASSPAWRCRSISPTRSAIGSRSANTLPRSWRSTGARPVCGRTTTFTSTFRITRSSARRSLICIIRRNLHAMRIRVGIDYNVPPNRVKDALFRAALRARRVYYRNRRPKVFLVDFADYADHLRNQILHGRSFPRSTRPTTLIRTNVWYKLKRQKITIPFPIRTLEVTRKRAVQPHEEHDRARAILEGEPLFDCLAASSSTCSFADRARFVSVAVKKSSSREQREPRCSSCCMVRPRSRFRRMGV